MTETNTASTNATSNEKSLPPETEGKKLGVLSRIKITMSNLALRLMARDEGDPASRDNGNTDSGRNGRNT